MRFNPHLSSIAPYEAGKPIELVVREYGINPKDVIKLASNENPFGSAKSVIKAIKKCAKNASLYPDDSYFELKGALAEKFGLDSENFIIGSGSDQILEFCAHAVDVDSKKDEKHEQAYALCAGITFAMYEIYSKLCGIKLVRTKSAWHDFDEFLKAYEKYKPKIIFICAPNNPLGECVDSEKLKKFIKKISKSTLIVIDGAYQEFASFKDASKKINPADFVSIENVIYLGTFSKAYGLGGMRVGYGIANAKLISTLHKIRPPFNITTISLKAAIEAIKAEKFTQKTIAKNFEQMSEYEKFAKAHNIAFIPSYANFITFISGDEKKLLGCVPDSENSEFKTFDSTHLTQWLLERGVILRNLKSYSVNAFRITIGKKDQNKKLFAFLEQYFSEFK